MSSFRPVGRSAPTLDVGCFAATLDVGRSAPTLDKDRVFLCRRLLHSYTLALFHSCPLRPNSFKCNTYKPPHKC